MEFFRGDGVCDEDCNVDACNYDDGDCQIGEPEESGEIFI